MSKLYLLFFFLGFVLDKVRIFPFIVGLIVGILIKAIIDNRPIWSLDTLYVSATDAYQRFQTTLTQPDHETPPSVSPQCQ